MCRSVARAASWNSTGPHTITSPVAPIRPASKPGSRRSAQRACVTAIVACMSCCVAKAGTSTSRRPTGFTGNLACNCATRRRSEVAGRSEGRNGAERDVGDVLRPRPVGDRQEDPRADCRRHVFALLPGHRPAIQLSGRGRRRQAGSCLRQHRLSEDDPRRSRLGVGLPRHGPVAYARGVTLDFSRPGKPTNNAFIEAFNGRFRAECLNAHWFLTLDDARMKMEEWRRYYNEDRPHGAIGNKRPIALQLPDGVASPSS